MRTNIKAIFESVLLGLTLLAAALAAWVAATGGVRFRPLSVALVAFAVRIAVGGRGSLRADATRVRRQLTPRATVIALISVVIGLGVMKGSGVAGGADSYGYVSQADLWLMGDGLMVAQPDAAPVHRVGGSGIRRHPDCCDVCDRQDPMQPSKLSSVPILVAAPQYDVRRDCVSPARVQPISAIENAAR